MNIKKTCLLTSLPKLDKDSHSEFLPYKGLFRFAVENSKWYNIIDMTIIITHFIAALLM